MKCPIGSENMLDECTNGQYLKCTKIPHVFKAIEGFAQNSLISGRCHKPN